MNADERAIAAVLASYEDALNRADTAAVIRLYTEDGVFMPQHFPSSVGVEAVRRAYDGVFDAIKLAITFAVVEINQVASDWAFARTTSAGTVTINANGQSGSEANQELFVLQKIDRSWKIARYSFSTTNPPRH